ncbi:MAG: nucleotidyltransferase family protein [Desulfobacterales bacterium]|jgi:molybdenum cofactor cytidylyltransferase|nr:nucleotidyltransferase family protein [Desulfobacterales bacterium]
MINVQPTAGIILAAGASTRFGEPKQLLRLKNKCLLEWVLDAALNSELNSIVLVLGYAHQKILQALGEKLQHSKLLVAINPQYEKGQSLSLHTGLSKVKDDYPAVMFLLGDQPMLNAATINVLLERFWADEKDICVPIYQGKRKTPTIFRRRFYTQLMGIKGDMGARQLIDDNPDRVLAVEMKNKICFFDVDTQQDLERLKKNLKKTM